MTKKRIIILAIVGVLSMVAVGGAFAQTTAVLNLQGTIAENIAISVFDAGANSLDLTTTAVDVKIADAYETSNVYNGYTIKIASTNGAAGSGLLQGTPGNPDTVTYTIKYDTVVADLTGVLAVKTVGPGIKSDGSTAVDVEISYTAVAADFFADDYTDDLTFTITAQ